MIFSIRSKDLETSAKKSNNLYFKIKRVATNFWFLFFVHGAGESIKLLGSYFISYDSGLSELFDFHIFFIKSDDEGLIYSSSLGSEFKTYPHIY